MAPSPRLPASDKILIWMAWVGGMLDREARGARAMQVRGFPVTGEAWRCATRVRPLSVGIQASHAFGNPNPILTANALHTSRIVSDVN